MEVVFTKTNQQGTQGKIVYSKFKSKPIVFNRGFFKTSDREQIQELLQSDLMKRNDIELKTPLEHVEKWLNGETPDKLTKEYLNKISAEGLKQIAEVIGLPQKKHNNYPSVIKAMIEGEPITEQIQNIAERNAKEEDEQQEDDLFTKAEEAGVIYRKAPWYKFKKGEKEDKSVDLAISKNKADAEKWLQENKEMVEKRLQQK